MYVNFFVYSQLHIKQEETIKRLKIKKFHTFLKKSMAKNFKQAHARLSGFGAEAPRFLWLA